MSKQASLSLFVYEMGRSLARNAKKCIGTRTGSIDERAQVQQSQCQKVPIFEKAVDKRTMTEKRALYHSGARHA
jgi:hypothetical protein